MQELKNRLIHPENDLERSDYQQYEKRLGELDPKEIKKRQTFLLMMAFMMLAGLLQILPLHCFIFAKNDKDIQYCNENCWGIFTKIILTAAMLPAPIYLGYSLKRRDFDSSDVMNGIKIEHTKWSLQFLTTDHFGVTFKVMTAFMVLNWLNSLVNSSFLSFSLELFLCMYYFSILFPLSLLNGLPSKDNMNTIKEKFSKRNRTKLQILNFSAKRRMEPEFKEMVQAIENSKYSD